MRRFWAPAIAQKTGDYCKVPSQKKGNKIAPALGESKAPLASDAERIQDAGNKCALVASGEERRQVSHSLASGFVQIRNIWTLALLGLIGSAITILVFVLHVPLTRDAVGFFRRAVVTIVDSAGNDTVDSTVNYTGNKASRHTGDNDEDVGAACSGRKGSFIVVGDWGYDEGQWQHGNIKSKCQKAIADMMLDTFSALGDVQFIINVGDSFYPNGVASKGDEQWDTKWRNVYPPELRSVPWYSVYGNHDYHKDPCACTDDVAECAQVNSNISDLSYFYMPGYNWHRAHPDLDMEVIALDMNHYMFGWFKDTPNRSQCMWDCQYTACHESCSARMEQRAAEAEQLLRRRYAESSAKNLVVFSHYPTDYFWSRPEFLGALRNASTHHIEFFGGHRHNTDQGSTTSILPNNNWLVGGGGGWSCDPPDVEGVAVQQGFVVGEILCNSSVVTYGVYVDNDICCPAGFEPVKKEDEKDPAITWQWPPRCKK